jgi:ABC-2 type transport system permease protein
MSSMRSTYLVALREATERGRSRAYIVSTIFTLVLIGGVVAVGVLTSGGPDTFTIGRAGAVPDALSASIDTVAVSADVVVTQTDYPSAEAARAAVAAGDIDGAVVGDDTVIVRSTDDTTVQAVLATALRQTRLIERLDQLGVSPQDLAAANVITIDTTEPPRDRSGEAIATAAIILLFVVITTYGQWVLLGVLEEKSTHVVEQIVSSTSVRSLLAGKVIGIGLLGLGQLAVIIVAAVVASTVFDLFELPAATYATASWALVWFLVGFAFYAVLYAAAASLVSRTEDAQTATMPIALFSVAAYLVAFAVVIPNPDSVASRIVSLIPPIAPIAFPGRIGFGGVATWEILLGLAITLASIAGVVRLAARVYAGALLSSGGRLKFRQAWRAARELASR